jgi:hypothetical protein
MGPRNAYKDMLDKVVSLIACVNMNHQNQLEQMANGAKPATGEGMDKSTIAHTQIQILLFTSHRTQSHPYPMDN